MGCAREHCEKVCANSFIVSQLSIQEWSKASDLAEAYSIGDRESGAAYNLLRCVDATTVSRLTEMVQTLGFN